MSAVSSRSTSASSSRARPAPARPRRAGQTGAAGAVGAARPSARPPSVLLATAGAATATSSNRAGWPGPSPVWHAGPLGRSGRVPLLERDDAAAAAAGYLADAAAGHGRLLFVAGEAGVGKTTFVGRGRRGRRRGGQGRGRPVRRVGHPGPARPAGRDAAGRCRPGSWPPGARPARGLHRADSPRCASRRGRSRTCWWSRTRTGPTRRPSTWSGTWPGGSTTAGRWCW